MRVIHILLELIGAITVGLVALVVIVTATAPAIVAYQSASTTAWRDASRRPSSA
jgi:hypothetical protein